MTWIWQHADWPKFTWDRSAGVVRGRRAGSSTLDRTAADSADRAGAVVRSAPRTIEPAPGEGAPATLPGGAGGLRGRAQRGELPQYHGRSRIDRDARSRRSGREGRASQNRRPSSYPILAGTARIRWRRRIGNRRNSPALRGSALRGSALRGWGESLVEVRDEPVRWAERLARPTACPRSSSEGRSFDTAGRAMAKLEASGDVGGDSRRSVPGMSGVDGGMTE